jgi:protein TonB
MSTAFTLADDVQPLPSTVTPNVPDRLSFALFLALAVHALLILGVTFAPQEDSQMATTLEVTLANYKSDKAPDEADFIAQENQQGSGTLEEAKLLTTDKEADFHDNDIRQTSPEEQLASAPKKQLTEQQQVSTDSDNRRKIRKLNSEAPTPSTDLPDGPKQSLLQRSLEMASLEAKLDSQRQAYARRPRVQRLTAASTMKATDAYYVNNWRRDIERAGARNYPREAKDCVNDCQLRLLVAIRPDGSIAELTVLESSGRKVLDDAAKRIVRQSAPFAPFTDEMRRDFDILEIIRTWQFKGNRYISEAG